MPADDQQRPILVIRGEGQLGGQVEFHLLSPDGSTLLVGRREGPHPGDDLEMLVQDIATSCAEFQDVIVDLGLVKWLNSTGLGWLVGLNRRRKQQGDAVVLAGANERIAQLLHITSLNLALACYETVAEAALALRQDGTHPDS